MILNLTQHAATEEQIAAGVRDLPELSAAALRILLTFTSLPDADDVRARAEQIADLAALNASPEDRGNEEGFALSAMIGGAPYLMAPLEVALREVGIDPLYAFSTRESVEEVQPDSSVRKVNVFRHAGFVGWRATMARGGKTAFQDDLGAA